MTSAEAGSTPARSALSQPHLAGRDWVSVNQVKIIDRGGAA